LWQGEWTPTGQAGRILRVPEERILAIVSGSGSILDEKSAGRVVPLAAQSRRAAIARGGALWVTQSNAKFGRRQKLDAKSGKVLEEHALPAGVEDIDFTPEGTLWAVSAASALRSNNWSTYSPLVFSLDAGALH